MPETHLIAEDLGPEPDPDDEPPTPWAVWDWDTFAPTKARVPPDLA